MEIKAVGVMELVKDYELLLALNKKGYFFRYTANEILEKDYERIEF